MCVCIYICIYMYTYIYTHIFIYMHIFIEKRKDGQTRWGLVRNRLAPWSLTPESAGFGGESGPQEPIPTQKAPEGLFTRRPLTVDSAHLRRARPPSGPALPGPRPRPRPHRLPGLALRLPFQLTASPLTFPAATSRVSVSCFRDKTT